MVLVMTGGGGQDVPWPEQLATEGIGTRIHVIVVAGRTSSGPGNASKTTAAYKNPVKIRWKSLKIA